VSALPPSSPLLAIAPRRRLDPAERLRLARRGRILAWAGNVWHLAEFAIALAAGVAASSVALVSFALDSLIELAAGLVIIWLLAPERHTSAAAERRAGRLIALSYFALAGYIAIDSAYAIVAGHHPEVSWVGIALAAVTAVTMPMLAVAKRRVGAALGSSATAREGTQNMLCAYLSAALLAGLGLNAAFGLWWADPVAATVIAAVAVREGVQGWRGDICSCCA
jgi:divalent metal cation (Fe/Co/Zn/Cd) transporter